MPAHSFFNNAGSVVPCRTVLIDMGLSNADPGLTPNGAKCGENMVCIFIFKMICSSLYRLYTIKYITLYF